MNCPLSSNLPEGEILVAAPNNAYEICLEEFRFETKLELAHFFSKWFYTTLRSIKKI